MSLVSTFKRVLVGHPLDTAVEEHQRLSKKVGLAVFSSDAISSTAYATEEILHVLVPVIAMAALGYLVPISLIVVVLLVIVVTSYRETLHAYPSGGGAYVVAHHNLGEKPALVAAGSLLVDYVLTVAVSVSAGVAAITSAAPSLRPLRIELCLLFVLMLMLGNLRGVKESGRIFAVPTYIYIVTLGLLIVVGLVRTYTGDLDPLPVDSDALAEFEPAAGFGTSVGLFLLMRAFSSGAVALSGVEAISNGISAFKPPTSRNASITLVWMAAILGGFFFGISVLANELRPTLNENETILSILGGAVFGRGLIYGVLQASTAGILILAANTAYADFPRLAALIGRDGYLPRQFANRGDRLVFSNGIMILSGAASVLLVAFGGVTNALIPLYAVGVFTSFTLSQSGMVRHHWRGREPGWRHKILVNAVGATATFVVASVVIVSKFSIGAWIPVVLIPITVALFLTVKRHYRSVAERLRLPVDATWEAGDTGVVILVSGLHRGTLNALRYASALGVDRITAVFVALEDEQAVRMREQWERLGITVPLEIREDPYRDLTQVVMRTLDELEERWGGCGLTVVIPEFVVAKAWEHLLHNQSALALKVRLRHRPDTVVVSVPYQLAAKAREGGERDSAGARRSEEGDGHHVVEVAVDHPEGVGPAGPLEVVEAQG